MLGDRLPVQVPVYNSQNYVWLSPVLLTVVTANDYGRYAISMIEARTEARTNS